jgi:hypothetical protein
MSLPPPRPHVEMVLIEDTPGTTAALANPWSKAARASALNSGRANAPAVAQPMKRKRKNRSCVWEFFTRSADGKHVTCDDEKCKWKAALVKCSTTNMRNHLQNEHVSLVRLLLYGLDLCFSMQR